MDSSKRSTYFEFFNEIGIIAQLSRAMMESRMPDGLTVPHFSVLNHLVRLGDGRTPLQIARAFQVPKTSMTNTLAGLERRALIDMRPNAQDGRSKQVWLTDKGRQFRDEMIRSLDPDIHALGDKLPVDDIAKLVPQLSEIRRILDAYRD